MILVVAPLSNHGWMCVKSIWFRSLCPKPSEPKPRPNMVGEGGIGRLQGQWTLYICCCIFQHSYSIEFNELSRRCDGFSVLFCFTTLYCGFFTADFLFYFAGFLLVEVPMFYSACSSLTYPGCKKMALKIKVFSPDLFMDRIRNYTVVI